VRYLIISDIHGNVHALEAVLRDARELGFDATVCLGDLVGYGADPSAVIQGVREIAPVAVVRGNHDKVCAGLEPAVLFNEVARRSIEWTRGVLTPDELAYLAALPKGPAVVSESLEICHGSPFDEDHYVFDVGDASRALDAAARPVCFFGHTHLPVVYRRDKHMDAGFIPHVEEDALQVSLSADSRYLVNPGSVGQPRDGDPRAAFAIYDADLRVLTLRRVTYAVEAAQRRIFDAGLPASLAHRLALGR
jgi:predicted phosphodiesterase